MNFKLFFSICSLLILLLVVIRESIIANLFNYIQSIDRDIKIKIEMLSNNLLEITPKDFFEIRSASIDGRRGKYISAQYDFPGVYILYNYTKDMPYVGQSRKVFQRVNNHLTGRGKGDVYADYKYGDDFTIRMIALENSGFSTLNELERITITTYNAYEKGYNRTKGNKG